MPTRFMVVQSSECKRIMASASGAFHAVIQAIRNACTPGSSTLDGSATGIGEAACCAQALCCGATSRLADTLPKAQLPGFSS